MRTLIIIIVSTLPLYGIGRFFGGKYVSHSYFLVSILVLLSLLKPLLRQYRFKKDRMIWMRPFLFFLFIGLLGLLTSPYGTKPWLKGFIQICGIATMIFMSFSVVAEISNRPRFMLKMIKVSMMSLGIIASIGIGQFLLYNFTPWGDIADFSFMNDLAGGEVWRNPGKIGNIHRANSLVAEPAHFTRYLGFGLGVALIRVGSLGRKLKKYISPVSPLWASWAIILGFFVSVSILGWLLMILIAMLLIGVSKPFKMMPLAKASTVLFVVIITLFGMSKMTDNAFNEKLATLNLLVSGAELSFDKVQGIQLSALAVTSNMTVAKSNFLNNPFIGGGLGSHPIAYKRYAPDYVNLVPVLRNLNADDASGLLLRLLSETGFIGTFLFVAGFIRIFFKARQGILSKVKLKNTGTLTAACIGISASYFGIFIIYLVRLGHYYDPLFWILAAMVVTIPQLLRRSTYDERVRFDVS